MKKILMLKPKDLLTHPLNMRRFYPANDVREMANSIKAAGGVIQPMIVVKAGAKEGNKYFVVDGNMRLAGARLLGGDCPALQCIVVTQTKSEQMLSMIIANQVRYDVDPVSEGLHYKALREEGLSFREISKRTGVYEARIVKRKILADLPVEIQQLIVDGKLPADERAAKALLSIPGSRAIKLAERLAQNPNVKIKTIVAAAEKLAAGAGNGAKLKRPGAELSGALTTERKSASVAELRAAAKKTCSQCNQYEGNLRKTPEPAWAAVVHATDQTCNKCPLKDMQNICGACPVVHLLKRLVAHE